jgi:hypothetical protein
VATTGEEIEAAAKDLAGRRVDDVRYYTMPYGMADTPAWDRGVAHVTDYGIDLVTSDGTTGITWTQYGEFGYGLRLARGPLLAGLDRAEFWAVAEEPPWGAVLGECITEARVHWLDVTWGERETTGPVALSLRFTGSISIAIVCGSWSGPEQSMFPTGDDIVVLWQPEIFPVLAPFLPSDLLSPVSRPGDQDAAI